jgi:FAD/FMN-containing dehydrogenase
MPRAPDPATLSELKAIVGNGGWVDLPADIAPLLTDHRRLYRGASPLALLPRTTEEVSGILAACDRNDIAIVAQGGNTSYCGAATPDESGTQIVLAMRRMNRVRGIDADNYSMIVEAGVTLAAAQTAARDADRLFPLSLGSEGTAQIGGNLSTNAGGTAVLRYGMMRDLVFGLEVVLADGRVISGLTSLRKDNTGYDTKSLFIGAEGTLGIITAASLKLFPLPRDVVTALIGVESARHALDFLVRLRGAAGDQVTSFEIMPRRAVELTALYIEGVANPLAQRAAWYVLAELSSPNSSQGLTDLLTGQLESAAGDGIVVDAMVAASIAQARAMWKLREGIAAAQTRHGESLKHDISVPITALPALIERGTQLAMDLVPEGEVISYGHLGDGNLHFNVSQRPGTDAKAFLARKSVLEEAVFDLVGELGGSFSAEHGVGRLRAAQLARRTDAAELSVMHALKKALDPKGILNPGKVLL